MAASLVLGIDLSGPTNVADTALSWFRAGERLRPLGCELGLGDRELLDRIAKLGSGEALVVGIDAPLSYNPRGGDRPGDASLRRALVAKGLRSGSVMTPTMTRMAYLTLRGISVARLLAQVRPDAAVVEVHPGGVMALRGAPVEDVLAFKHDADARGRLAAWLTREFLDDELPAPEADHVLAAHACAVGAWCWSRGGPTWIEPREVPFHPYDYAC